MEFLALVPYVSQLLVVSTLNSVFVRYFGPINH